MDSGETRDRLTDLVTELAKAGAAIAVSVHKKYSIETGVVRVAWAEADRYEASVYDTRSGSVDQYFNVIRSQQFSAVLRDGAVVLVSVDFRDEEIVAHRFGFYPCPIDFTADELEDLTIEDFLSLLSGDELLSRASARPYLRFDYDSCGPEVEPLSHLHTTYADCRIAVCGPLSIGQFLRFVFENFYPETWQRFQELLTFDTLFFAHNIRAHEKESLHLSISRPSAGE